MGLKNRLLSAFFLFIFGGAVNAAPMLRLVSSTVGPIPVAVGGSAPAQTVEAYNAGDGSLGLSLSSSVSWIVPTLGASRACVTTTAAASCIPLQLALNTSSLAAGTYTGIVTVTGSASTVDAPQTITVTVRVGTVTVYAAPGTTTDVPITTTKMVNWNTTNGSGWLSLVLEGTGSFRFVFPYNIHFAPQSGMATGDYNATLATTGSAVPQENVTIPVLMHLTTQPIAGASPAAIALQLAQGAPPLVYPFSIPVSLINQGQGTLTPGAITTATSSCGGSWLKQDTVPSYIAIDPTGLSPGTCTGTVTIASNAVNGPTNIPVSLEIVPQGAPTINYQGVVDDVTFIPGAAVSPGDVTLVKGAQLSFSAFSGLQSTPLPTQLGGATVLVNGTAAPFYYSSSGQLAFQMPYGTPAGTALVQVQRDGQSSNTVSVNVAQHAPQIFAVLNPDGSYNLPDGSHPAKLGDEIVIWAFGLGATSPAVATGAAAPGLNPGDTLAQVTGLQVNFGGGAFGSIVTPDFAGLTPPFAGVYQVNVKIPVDGPTGIVDLSVNFSDARSNSLNIVIQ